MNIPAKIRKFNIATNKEKVAYVVRFFKAAHLFILPFVQIFTFPFISKKSQRNLLMDLLERICNYGPHIRYRYYLGYKLFYSCSKEGIGIVNHIMCDRIYEQETCTFLKQSLISVEHPHFIDIGANIGLISLYLLNEYPNIKIHAFEPSPHQNMLFAKTIKENNISDRILLSDNAASDKEGEVSFFMHNEANCSGDGFIDTGRGGSGESIQVKTIPLDIWWKSNKKPPINLIKIDTEGAELLVLKGAKELLETCSPDIFFEMQENNYRVYGYTYQDVLSFFREIGYSVCTEDNTKLDENTAPFLMKNAYNFIARKTR